MSNPFEDAAAELDGQQSQPQQSAQVASSATGNPFADAAAELDGQTLQAQTPQLDSVENYQKQQSGGTSDNPFKAVIEFTQMLGEAHEVGQSGFRESSLGHAVWDGRLTLEEATKQIEADDHLAQMSGDLKRYTEDSAIPWLTDIALSTAKSLPMIEASLAVGAAGFGTGAGGTVALTAGAGTPLAVPVGSMLGTAATAGWTADYLKGQEYLKRRQQGYDHETAAAASTVSGLVQGALSGLKFGQAAKVPLNTAGNILKAHATSIAKGLFDGVKFGAEQIALSEAGTATKLITDAIAGTVANVPNAVPTLEQAVQEFSNTFNETLKTSLGLFAGGKVAGTAAGITLKGVLKKTHDAHLKNQQAKLEKTKAAEEAKAQPEGQDAAQSRQDNGRQSTPAEPSKSAQERKARAEARLDKRIKAENEIRRIFDAANSRWYIAADETRLQEVNRIQRLLKRMVKNSDTLDDATKAKLLARVIEIDGVADLLKAGEKFIEEQQTKEYKNAMAEAVTKLQGAIKSGQVKGKKAALPQEAQASLGWYHEFFTVPKIVKEKGANTKSVPFAEMLQSRIASHLELQAIKAEIAARTDKNQKQLNRLLAIRNKLEERNANIEIPEDGQFHGTSKPIENLESIFEGGGNGEKNLYGPGFYVTSNYDVAVSYTGKGKGKIPTVYKVKWLGDKPAKLFDLDEVLPEDKREAFIDGDEYMPHEEEDINRPAKEIYAEFVDNMSRDYLYSYDAYEQMLNLVSRMQEAGYDGFTHTGGGKFRRGGQVVNETQHKVSIYFEVDKIGLEKMPRQRQKKWIESIDINELPQKIEQANPIEPLKQKMAQLEQGLRDEVGKEYAASKVTISDKQKGAAYSYAADYVERGMAEEAKNLSEQVDKLEKGELAEIFNQPESLLEKRRIAMQAMQFWSGKMDQASVVDLAGEVQEMVNTGKSKFLERKKAEGERLLKAREEVLNAVQGIKPVKPSTDPNPAKQMTGFGKLAHSVRRTSTSLWDKLLQDTPVDERQKLISKVLDFTEAENKEATINLAAAEKLTTLFGDAVGGGIKEASKLIRDGADPKKRIELKFTNAEGATVVEHYTLNELTYLNMAFDDPGAVPGLLRGNKYTLKGEAEAGHTSTQEAVQRILSEHADGKYLQLGEAVKDFYRWYAPMIANHYLHEYGVVLPMDDNYSGQIFHRHIERQKTAADILNDVHQTAQRSLDPGSTKARSNSKLPVKLVDPFQQVQRHRADMAFWMANSAKARELSFIFSDSTKDGLRDVIAHKLGSDFNGLIESRIAFAFHLKPGIRDIGDGPLQTIKSNMATGMLGARIDQAPKQWTAILAPLNNSSTAEFLDGLRGAMDKERLNGYLSMSELYKDRQSHILPQILEATKERGYVDTVTGDKALALKTFFLTPMHKWGDGVGAAVSGFIEYNRVLKSGGTVEEAVLAGDRLVDSTQSSSRPSQKVPAEMKGGVANLSLAFQKEAIQAMNRESGAIRDWFIHKDDKHLQRMARVIVSIHVAQTLFQAINNTPAFLVGDEKEQQEAGLRIASAAIAGSYGQMPLVGFDVVHGVLSGWKGNQDPRTVVGGLAADSAKLVKRLYKITEEIATGEDVEGDDWIKAFKSLASVGSVATGLPFWGLFKYGELGGKVLKKASGED